MSRGGKEALLRAAPASESGSVAAWLEYGLDGAAFLFLPVLALASRGLAPLEAVAGACALGLVICRGRGAVRPLFPWAALLGALVLWGAASAAWAPEPGRSLVMAARLLGLFAAGLALVAAAPIIAAPRLLLRCLYAGLALAVPILVIQLATQGWLTQPFFERDFVAAQLNQASDTLAILLLPASATLLDWRRGWAAALVAAAVPATIFALVGTAAKATVAAGIAAALLLYCCRRPLARAGALACALIVLTAPLTFTRLAEVPGMVQTAGDVKNSASHRLLIWFFAGERIAEKPLAGWGLDSSRAIPGGSEWIRPGEPWLPLHPHNAPVQLWLELGVPGAVAFTLLLAGLWLRLAEADWPRLFAAAAGGGLATAIAVSLGTYGIWQEWWQGTLWFLLFLILVMARSLGGDQKRSHASAAST